MGVTDIIEPPGIFWKGLFGVNAGGRHESPQAVFVITSYAEKASGASYSCIVINSSKNHSVKHLE